MLFFVLLHHLKFLFFMFSCILLWKFCLTIFSSVWFCLLPCGPVVIYPPRVKNWSLRIASGFPLSSQSMILSWLPSQAASVIARV